MKKKSKIMVNEVECVGCRRLCIVVCPVKAMKIDEDKNKVVIDHDKCILCGKCIKECTNQALYMKKK